MSRVEELCVSIDWYVEQTDIRENSNNTKDPRVACFVRGWWVKAIESHSRDPSPGVPASQHHLRQSETIQNCIRACLL